MALPNEPGGFAVNRSTGEIHKRHAGHAASLRRTTRLGAEALLGDRKPKLCDECFPRPAKAERKQPAKTKETDGSPVED